MTKPTMASYMNESSVLRKQRTCLKSKIFDTPKNYNFSRKHVSFVNIQVHKGDNYD
jgi:hypothetical protein